MLPAQRLFEALGKSGCYLLSLLHLGGVDDPSKVVELSLFYLSKGWIDESMFVRRPDLILGGLLNKKVSVSFQKGDYVCGQNEMEVLVYSYNKFDHFVLDGYDPLGVSNSVKYGKLTSKRVFRVER